MSLLYYESHHDITEILLKVALNTTNQTKCNQILQIKGTTMFLFPVLPEHFVVFDRFSLQTVTVCVEVLVRSSFNTF